MLQDHYYHQTTNNFEELLKQKNAKNNLIILILILWTIGMHIGLTKFLEIGPLNVEYDLKKRLYERCANTNWGNNDEIKEVIAANINKDNNKKDPWEKNRRFKKEKQSLK